MVLFLTLLSPVVFFSVFSIYLNSTEHRLFSVIKPLPVFFLFASLFIFVLRGNEYNQLLVVAGLFFGMVGDYLLIKNRYFVHGLLSFLVGHLFYIAYFIVITPSFDIRMMAFIIPALIYAGFFFRKKKEQTSADKLPVAFYMVVITLMLISAGNLLSADAPGAVFFFIGALLFYLSDSILAWHLMVSPIKMNSLLVLGPYYSGQMFITSGILVYHLF